MIREIFFQASRFLARHQNDVLDSTVILVIWIKLLSVEQRFLVDPRYIAIIVAAITLSILVISRLNSPWCSTLKHIQSEIYDSFFCLAAALIFGWLLVLNNSSSQSTFLLPVMLLIWPSLSALHHVRVHPLVLAACWIVCLIFLFASSSHFRNNVSEGIVIAVLSLMLLVGCYSSPRLSEKRLIHSNQSASAVSPCKEAEYREQLPKNDEERAQRYLIANVAHDMKSPLAALESGCDALKTSLERISHFIAMHQKEQQQQELPSLAISCGQDSHSCQALAEVRGMEETLKLIFGTCGMVQAMVNRYTDYAKAQLGVGLHAHLTSFVLEEVVQSIAETFLLMQQRVKITVKTAAMIVAASASEAVKKEDRVLMVRADRQWVYESLLCLVSNAVKYCSSGAKDAESVDRNYDVHSSGEVVIRCLCVANPKNSAAAMMIRIEVEDNGCGVAADLRNELFTPMNMMKYTTGGTGLGLYILAQRVAAMGGQYGYSAVGEGGSQNCDSSSRGSVFWFTFPEVFSIEEELPSSTSVASALDSCCDDSDISLASPTLNEKLSRCTSPERSFVHNRQASSSPVHFLGDAPKQQFKFLLVDDAMPILRMTRRMLENEGHMVMDAVNGRDALHVLARDNGAAVDVVLMDIQMPIMDGIEATKQFRQLQREEQAAAKTMQHEEPYGFLPKSKSLDDTEDEAAVLDRNFIGPAKMVTSDSTIIATNSLASSNGFMPILDLTATPFSPNRKIIDSSHHYRLPIIIGCSANSDHVTFEEAMAAGMDAFIPKPVTMKKVYATLQQLGCLG